MGFYAGKGAGLKSPIICVNTVYHKTVMSATFAHEMGHHVFSQASGSRDNSVHLLSFTGFLDHLKDPSELAADVLVSIGIFPRAYLTGPRALTTGGSRLLPMDGVRHIAARYGLNLEEGLPPESRLQYLAGVIHYTKLRQAILEEYDL